jgi:hypothetical protein
MWNLCNTSLFRNFYTVWSPVMHYMYIYIYIYIYIYAITCEVCENFTCCFIENYFRNIPLIITLHHATHKTIRTTVGSNIASADGSGLARFQS